MFLDFFYTLREFGLPVSPTEWFGLLETLQKGLARSNLQEFYYLARAVLVKDERDYDRYDQAFLKHFKGIEPPPSLREELFEWLDDAVEAGLIEPGERPEFEEMPFDELMEEFKKRLEEQTERHDGGSKWIGTGGTSPWGHSGRGPAGIRVGGRGGGMRALQVAAERRFMGYRSDRVLDIRQMKVALKKLRRLVPEGPADELDVDETVSRSAKNAGDIECVFRRPRKNSVRLALFMDTGGSMDPFARLVDRLFSAASGLHHFREFRHYYFHNCIYEYLWTQPSRNERVPTAQVLREVEPEWRVIFCGDACMAWSELTARYGAIDYYHRNEKCGIEWLQQIAERYPRVVWLNPIRKAHWNHPTIQAIGSVIPMFPLSLEGLEEAVDALKRSRR